MALVPQRAFLRKKKLFIYLAVFGSWLHSSRSFIDVYRLSSCGVWVKLLLCIWDLSSPTGDQTLASQGRFLTTEPPRKPPKRAFKWPLEGLAHDLCSLTSVSTWISSITGKRKLVETQEGYQCTDCYKIPEKIVNSLWVAGESYS